MLASVIFRIRYIQKLLTVIIFSTSSLLVIRVAIAQQQINIDQNCNTAVVEGVNGEIWQLTRNGVVSWVILDENKEYLADAPADCAEKLEMLLGEQSQMVESPAASAKEYNNDIVIAHNRVRRGVGITEDLQWSDELAAYAQQWADVLKTQKGCDIEHRPQSGQYTQKYGENLSWVSGTNQSGSSAVRAWASEKEYYQYETSSCAGVCGHYTQIVWRNTQYVGCATASCPNGYDDRNTQLWVCNYHPAGNIIDRKPY